MKKLNYLLLFVFISSSLLFTACEEDNPVMDDPIDNTQMTIAEFVADNDDYSILGEALDKTGLTSVVGGSDMYTVFAPNNDAFNMLFADLGVTGIADISAETLTPILLYHVMSGSITSDMIQDGYYSSMSPAQGKTVSMKFSTENGVMINGSTEVVAADIDVENGVIHAIDKVLLPPSIVDIAANDGNFGTLVSAVTGAGLADVLADANGSFTVFAPVDAAFEALGDNVPADLTPILLYHVLGTPVFAEMVSNGIINSLNSEDPEIIVEINDMNVILNGSAKVVGTDIVGTNGVIHVIDEVILPINNNSILDLAMGLESFSSLVAALAKTGLASTFAQEGEFTVFAPTNDAFSSFLNGLDITLDDVSKEELAAILKYHVLGTKVASSQISTGYVNTLYEAIPSNPVSLLIEAMNGAVKLNGSSNVAMADVMASNGIIHVIDAVLTPTTVVDIAINNKSFSSLVEAVIQAGLVETLQGEGPFTIFAPTDDAFAETLQALGLSSVSEINNETLTSILQYHVVSGNVKSTDLSEGAVSTLNGDITISLENDPMINGDTKVVQTDIQGTNGVIHVINKVLLP
jgi:transforming growth factor-beta-induced protein